MNIPKRRKTAQHYTEVPTKDGQDIECYDFAELCVECSKGQYSWRLHAGYKIKGRIYERII